MVTTQYSDMNPLLAQLGEAILDTLGDQLLGLYLYGSLVYCDFDSSSDIDMAAVLAADLNDIEAVAIEQMHADFAAQHPLWDNRVEVQYVAADGLRSFKTQPHKMGNISPGESFHIIDADQKWLINWWLIQEQGMVLYGPPPDAFIPPISHAEYLIAVREHAQYWIDNIEVGRTSSYGQSYPVLTLCRALYSVTFGEQVSKVKAAAWTAQQMPEWATLIDYALRWRKHWRSKDVTPEVTYPDFEHFVHDVVRRILTT